MKKQRNTSFKRYCLTWREYDKLWLSFVKACRISAAEFDVLIALCDGYSTQTEICEFLLMRKQTVNSAVKKLTDRGLVRLEMLAEDHRNKKIIPTEAGYEFIGDKVEFFLEAGENAWNAISAGERSEIIALSEKYNRLLEKELQSFFEERA